MVRTAPLSPALGALSLTDLGGQARMDGEGNSPKHPPAAPQGQVQQLIILPVIPMAGDRCQDLRPRAGAGSIRSLPLPPPINRHSQLMGARRHRLSPWQRRGPDDADRVAVATLDRMMGTWANGRAGEKSLSQATWSSPCLGQAGPPPCVSPQVPSRHRWVPLQPPMLGWGPFFLPPRCI